MYLRLETESDWQTKTIFTEIEIVILNPTRMRFAKRNIVNLYCEFKYSIGEHSFGVKRANKLLAIGVRFPEDTINQIRLLLYLILICFSSSGGTYSWIGCHLVPVQKETDERRRRKVENVTNTMLDDLKMLLKKD